MNPQSPSLEFIALFNELDKYLEDVINDCDQHMNFAHKLKIISQWSYMISRVVKKYFYELNYLAELRNQLVHGINLRGEDYIIPTQYALDQMQDLCQTITQYEDRMVCVQESDLISDIISMMMSIDSESIAVYRDQEYLYECDRKMLLYGLINYDWDRKTVRLVDFALHQPTQSL